MDGEISRDVPSVPGILVSSEGHVMTIPFRGPMPKGGERAYGGSPYFGVWNKQAGRFIIVIDGHSYKIHQLIAEAFHGPAPFDGAVVMHLDENAANNRASNLKWERVKKTRMHLVFWLSAAVAPAKTIRSLRVAGTKQSANKPSRLSEERPWGPMRSTPSR